MADWIWCYENPKDAAAEIAALRARAEFAERELDTMNRVHADMAARLAESGRENERLRTALGSACRQWKMYAEMEDERTLATETTIEGCLYSECVKLAGRVDEQSPTPAGKAE